MKITKNKLKQIIDEEVENACKETSTTEDTALISEGSFGRVKDKIEKQKVPFVMMSAFRGGLSRKENMKRQKELENAVSAAGFPFSKMPGSGYVEEPEEEGGEPLEVKENSILIYDEERADQPRVGVSLFETAQQLAKKYNQDSFIFGKPEEAGDEAVMTVRVYDKDGGLIKEPWAGPWYSISQAADDDFYWSVVGGKRAKLVELQKKWGKVKAGSMMGAIKKQHYCKAAKSGLLWIESRETEV